MAKIAVTGEYPDTHVADSHVPGLRQLVLDSVSGVFYLGNGVTPMATLPPIAAVYGAGAGPIVTDASDGHTYRLGTDAGVLTITVVT